MNDLVNTFVKKLRAVAPWLDVEVREHGTTSVWIDVSSPELETWWEVVVTQDSEHEIYAHYPDDPDDVAFAPPDDWFQSPLAAALFLKSASTTRVRDPHALGPYVVTAQRDGRERIYTFDNEDGASAFVAELAKQGIPVSQMAYYQRKPVPPTALSA